MKNVIERNNVKIRGQGEKALIFAHGFGCNQNMWRLVAPSFESDYQVVLFDHVGAGRSHLGSYHRSKYSTLQAYADDLLEICDRLDLQDAIFVGHSVSAMIGVLASIRDPKAFEKLVLIGPSPCYLNDGDYRGGFEKDAIEALLGSLSSNFTVWSTAMAPVIMGNLDRPQLGAELVESFCETRPEIARQFAQVVFTGDNRADLPKVRAETLILQCTNDSIAPEAVGRYVHERIAGSRLKQLKATGHCPHLSEPQETIAAIKEFLAQTTLQRPKAA